MAAYSKFYVFVLDIGLEKHQLNTDNLYVALTNTTPDANNHIQMSNLTIISGNNYANVDILNNYTRTDNIAYLKAGTNAVFTAAGGNFGPFRYVVMYNNDEANKALIGYWDYGSSINCNNGESFTWQIPANNVIANLT